MSASTPHFLLFSEARGAAGPDAQAQRGRWRFVLEALDGSERFEAADEEPESAPQRLALLAVVRGLEALDQPSRVTLVTSSSYVSRGIRFGLAEWRENDWMWERFGKMTPVKDSDLWRRVDQALQYHQVECRTWRFEPTAAVVAETAPAPVMPPKAVAPVSRRANRPKHGLADALAAAQRVLERGLETVRGCLESVRLRLSSPLTTSSELR